MHYDIRQIRLIVIVVGVALLAIALAYFGAGHGGGVPLGA